MPPPGAVDAWPIWYRLMDLTGVFVSALAPVCAVARLTSTRRKSKVPALVATGANAYMLFSPSCMHNWCSMQ